MYEYKAKIIRVVDGDTVEAELDLGFRIKQEMRIRLLNIDTPEIFHPESAEEKILGNYIKNWLMNEIEGKEIFIRTHKDTKDKYGRYLATLYTNYYAPASINDEMIGLGFDKAMALNKATALYKQLIG